MILLPGSASKSINRKVVSTSDFCRRAADIHGHAESKAQIVEPLSRVVAASRVGVTLISSPFANAPVKWTRTS